MGNGGVVVGDEEGAEDSKSIVLEHLVGSVGRACDSLSRGLEFKLLF